MQASDPPSDEAPALEALLRWYAAMGVDATIDEDPHDRFLPPPPEAAREPKNSIINFVFENDSSK